MSNKSHISIVTFPKGQHDHACSFYLISASFHSSPPSKRRSSRVSAEGAALPRRDGSGSPLPSRARRLGVAAVEEVTAIVEPGAMGQGDDDRKRPGPRFRPWVDDVGSNSTKASEGVCLGLR